jgi:hypothetical protein
MRLLWLAPALALCLSAPSDAGTASHHSACCGSHKGWKRSRTPTADAPSSPRCADCAHKQGVKRSLGATHETTHQTGGPHGRTGNVVEQATSPACGGAGVPPRGQAQAKPNPKAKGTAGQGQCGR